MKRNELKRMILWPIVRLRHSWAATFKGTKTIEEVLVKQRELMQEQVNAKLANNAPAAALARAKLEVIAWFLS